MDGKTLHVVNYHGAAFPGDKLDDPLRLAASQGLIDFMATKEGPKVLGGDFNLLPEAQSVRMFEGHGYTDHIKKNAIPTTRNHLVWDRWPGNKQDYADFVFTSPEVAVNHFEVIENEVSDHLPLVLDIQV
jgi:endonuclease/exonuclease/phosphatase family metal-dependent hydrolase